jgi:hypothetical protein
MLLAVELITTLVLGFLLGRIWQIRRQILLAENVSKRRRPIASGVAGKDRSQPTDCKPSMLLDRSKKELRPAPAAALHFRSSPAVFAGGFRASHQSLRHVDGSAL